MRGFLRWQSLFYVESGSLRMILSDRDIKINMETGMIHIEPTPEPECIQPASVDIRLGALDGVRPNFKYLLQPGEFILGSTIEYLEIPRYVAARFEGKSSLGRKGLMTHITAGFIDPGFEGQLTLEIFNASKKPIELYSEMFIGQVCFFTLSSPPDRVYGDTALHSHYQGQIGPTRAWDAQTN